MINSYGKIYNLGHRALRDLLDGEVTVEEKVDGSQFSFGKDEAGNLFIRSKNVDMDPSGDCGMFNEAARSVCQIYDKLTPGWVYRGEYLKGPRHNTLEYGRIPVNHIVLFDIDTAMQDYLDVPAKHAEADRLGLEVVPALYVGRVDTFEFFQELLGRESFLGGPKIEGVVIKNYDRFDEKTGKVLMGKHKSNPDWKKTGNQDIKYLIANQFRTEARWDKAVQHMREDGHITDGPRDIGGLMKAVSQDVYEECQDEIKEALFKWAWKDISRMVTSGLPDWYKNKLAQMQFEERSE